MNYSIRPTPAQLYAVNLINTELNMNAHPTTKFEASDFIGKHYEKAKLLKANKARGFVDIRCPHQHNCSKAGTIADYCYEEYDDDAPCSNFLPLC